MKNEDYLKGHGNACTITVNVSPGASKSEILGVSPWRKALQIKIAAPAKEGEANAELLRFLSETLLIPARSIRLVHGQRSSVKVIEVPMSVEKVRRVLGGT